MCRLSLCLLTLSPGDMSFYYLHLTGEEMQIEGGCLSDFPKVTTSQWQSGKWTSGLTTKLTSWLQDGVPASEPLTPSEGGLALGVGRRGRQTEQGGSSCPLQWPAGERRATQDSIYAVLRRGYVRDTWDTFPSSWNLPALEFPLPPLNSQNTLCLFPWACFCYVLITAVRTLWHLV